MNPLTQQHVTHITLSGRGGEKEKVEGWWEVFTVKKPKGNTVNLGEKKNCVVREGGGVTEREIDERGQKRVKVEERGRDGWQRVCLERW